MLSMKFDRRLLSPVTAIRTDLRSDGGSCQEMSDVDVLSVENAIGELFSAP